MKRRRGVGLQLADRDQAHVHADRELAVHALVLGVERIHEREPRLAPNAIGKGRVFRYGIAGNVWDLAPAVEPERDRAGRGFTAEELDLTERRRGPEAWLRRQAGHGDAPPIERHVVRASDDLLHLFSVLLEPGQLLIELELALHLLLMRRDAQVLRRGRAHEAVPIRHGFVAVRAAARSAHERRFEIDRGVVGAHVTHREHVVPLAFTALAAGGLRVAIDGAPQSNIAESARADVR